MARMDRSLHDTHVKCIPEPSSPGGSSDLREVSKQRMMTLTADGGGASPGADSQIEIHHVSGSIATALVRSIEYPDYLQLVESADGWQIANILFRTHD